VHWLVSVVAVCSCALPANLMSQVRLHARRFQATCNDSPPVAVPPPDAAGSGVPLTDLFLNDDIDWADEEALLAMEDWAPLSEGPHTRTRNRFLNSPAQPAVAEGPTEPHRPVTRSHRRNGASRGERRTARTAALRAHVETLAASGKVPAEAVPVLPPPAAVPKAAGQPACADAASTACADAAAVAAVEQAAPVGSPFSCAQIRQLHAQVQAHAQLLLQTLALAGQHEVSDVVTKRWGWSANDAQCDSEFRRKQDAVAAEACRMLAEWRDLADGLVQSRAALENPPLPLDAPLLAAITVDPQQPDPGAVVDGLLRGWRPIVCGSAAPSIAHVPWLAELDDMLAMMGFAVKRDAGMRAVSLQMVRNMHSLLCAWPFCAAASARLV
jgi:hypothetical protein